MLDKSVQELDLLFKMVKPNKKLLLAAKETRRQNRKENKGEMGRVKEMRKLNGGGEGWGRKWAGERRGEKGNGGKKRERMENKIAKSPKQNI